MATKFQFRFSHAPVRFFSDRPSKTRSEFRSDCDIRNIILRHSLVPPVSPVFVDLTSVPDSVQGILEFARTVAADFDSLPLKARQRFNYDPEALVSFLLDDRNRAEAVSLGLISPSPVLPTDKPSTPNEVNNNEK